MNGLPPELINTATPADPMMHGGVSMDPNDPAIQALVAQLGGAPQAGGYPGGVDPSLAAGGQLPGAPMPKLTPDQLVELGRMLGIISDEPSVAQETQLNQPLDLQSMLGG